jgi:hypothetical protein
VPGYLADRARVQEHLQQAATVDAACCSLVDQLTALPGTQRYAGDRAGSTAAPWRRAGSSSRFRISRDMDTVNVTLHLLGLVAFAVLLHLKRAGHLPARYLTATARFCPAPASSVQGRAGHPRLIEFLSGQAKTSRSRATVHADHIGPT